jgi:hypothetical protein
MEYMIQLLADMFKPKSLHLPSFGFTQLQPVDVKNIKQSTHKNY